MPTSAVLSVAVAAAATQSAVAQKTPLVLIPGFTGASLEVELKNKRTKFPADCPTTTNGQWDVIWMDDRTLAPAGAVCFMENMEIGVSNGKYTTTPGVSIRPRAFGKVDGLVYLDNEKKHPSFYGKVVDFFELHGYKREVDLFGAPYDWRYSLERVDSFFSDLQKLVEDVHARTGRKVALFSHSLGPSVTLEFLRTRPAGWKDEHITTLFAITPVWSGNVVSVNYAISGINCREAWDSGCSWVPTPITRWFLREVLTNLPSSFFTFPLRGEGERDDTWGKEDVLIQTPSKNYTAYDMPQMMQDLGLGRGKKILQKVEASPGKATFPAPGVDTYVFYGQGLPTPSKFVYSENFRPLKQWEAPPKASKIEYLERDNGDGICPLRTSLRSTLEWPAEQAKLGKVLEHKGYTGMEHKDTTATLPDILAILQARDRAHDAAHRTVDVPLAA